MDDMEWHTKRDLEPQVRCMNTCASADGARRAQNCALYTSVCFVVSVPFVRNVLQVVHVVREDVRSLPYPNVREYEVQDTFPLQSVLLSWVHRTHFLRYWDQSRFVPLTCVWASVVRVAQSLQTSNRAPRHTFQLHHVTTSWFLHYSCQTFDRFRDVYTISRQIRTTQGSTPKQRCLLSFENRTVIDRILPQQLSVLLSESWPYCLGWDRDLPATEKHVSGPPQSSSIRHWSLWQICATLSILCPDVVLRRSWRSVSFQISLSTFFQRSLFDLLLPQSQNRLHGRIHSQALICTSLNCLHQAQNHCCGSVHTKVSDTHCSNLAFRTSSSWALPQIQDDVTLNMAPRKHHAHRHRKKCALDTSKSRKSAVGPAEYRLTLSNRPSSTSCFPNALNASFTNLGEYIAADIVSFRSIDRTRPFSPACSLASSVASLELLVGHLVFPRTNPCSLPSPIDAKRQWHTDPAPNAPFHHSAILPSLAYTSSTRALGARARNVYPWSTVSWTLRCTLACTVFLGLALCQFGSSFLAHNDRKTCGKRCMVRFQSVVMSVVFVTFAPIFLCPLSFRGPRIVRRHVLLSNRWELNIDVITCGLVCEPRHGCSKQFDRCLC